MESTPGGPARAVLAVVARLAVILLAACPEPLASDCGVDQVCPPFTLCGPGGTCPVIPGECARFDDGTPCAAAGRALCQQGECKPSLCGDVFFDPENGEACDLGAENTSVPDGSCRPDCSVQRCGDGTTDTGEACDSGTANSDLAPNECRTSCVKPFCGDGILDLEERASCFGSAQSFATGDGPAWLAHADLDGDGRGDVVLSNIASEDNSILLGLPGGGFGPATRIATGRGRPQGVAAGDLTGDGVVDLIVANGEDASVSVFVGVGNGTFGSPREFPTGNGPSMVALGDLDGDARLDAVVANRNSGDISVFDGAGDGTLVELARIPVGAGVNSIALGDIDGDGRLDAVATNESSDSIILLRQVGDGALAPAPAVFAVGGSPAALVLADFDGDGLADVVVANRASDDVSILRNLGEGALAPQQRVPVLGPPTALTAGLVDDDDLLDLVVSHATAPFSTKVLLTVLRGTPGGGFVSADGTTVPGAAATAAVSLDDLDRDGRLDAIIAIPSQNRILTMYGGDGTLGRRQSHDVGADPIVTRLGDLDRDGHPDVFTIDRASGAVLVLMGTGDARLAPARELVGGESARDLALADVNYDTHLDLVLANGATAEIVVLLGDGQGRVAEADRYPITTVGSPYTLALGDLDRDGTLDLVVGTNDAGGAIDVRRGDPDGSFGPAQVFRGWLRTTAVIKLADVDEDGVLDLAVSSSNKAMEIFKGRGDGGFVAEPTLYFDLSLGRTFGLGDFTGDGRTDIVRMEADQRLLSFVVWSGSDGFELLSQTMLEGSVRFVDVVDLNGDGRDDVVGLDTAADEVVVFLGRDGATVTESQRFRSGDRPSAFVAGDLDADGLPDLVVTGADLSLFISHRSGGK